MAAVTRPGESRFVGREACAKCHEKEDAKWAPSDHALAMQPMNEKTVLANFDGASFDYHGVVSTFTKKDGRYFVRTDGPDGKLTDDGLKAMMAASEEERGPWSQVQIGRTESSSQLIGLSISSRPAIISDGRHASMFMRHSPVKP